MKLWIALSQRMTACVIFVIASTAASAQDAEAGKLVFASCAACHTISDSNGIGPGLKGIDGRKAGSVVGFRYSATMALAGYTWNSDRLDAFLSNPAKAMPGNAMPFAGIKDLNQRADLIAYLQTLK